MTATTDGYCYIKMVLAARAPDRMHRCEYCNFLPSSAFLFKNDALFCMDLQKMERVLM